MVDILDVRIDVLRVIALIADEGAFLKRNYRVRVFEYCLDKCGISGIGGSCKLIERNTGNVVNKYVVFVAPVELVIYFIMLV